METPKEIWRKHYGKPSLISKREAVDLVKKFYDIKVQFDEPDRYGYMRCTLPNGRHAAIRYQPETGIYTTVYSTGRGILESSSICRSVISARKHLIYLYEKEMRELGVRDPWVGGIPKKPEARPAPPEEPKEDDREASPFIRAITSGDDLSKIGLYTIIHLLEFLGIDPWRDEKEITISRELDNVLWDLVGAEKIKNSCFLFQLESKISYGTTEPVSTCWGISRAIKESASEKFVSVKLDPGSHENPIASIVPHGSPVGGYITAEQLVNFLSEIREKAGGAR